MKISNETIAEWYNFIIGSPARNSFAEIIISKEEFETKVSGKEGFLVKSKEDTLLFAGSNDFDGYDRGTLECLEWHSDILF